VTSTELVVRRAVEDDAGDIASVYLAARRGAPMPPPAHPDDAVRYWIAQKVHGDDETWVADLDGTVVGYARLAGDWLDDLYVAPPYAGRGIGTALLDLVKSLRPGGFCLWVFAMNRPARAFYARRGLLEIQHTDGRDNEEHTPDVELAWPGRDPLVFLRGLVDEVDDELGALLERRAALTAAIQGVKPVPGPAGRDSDRERVIAERMAVRAPALGVERLERIMHTVITESLDATRIVGGSA
jgi:GNAT superfamily N-acetyltransferase/chorismate mutase